MIKKVLTICILSFYVVSLDANDFSICKDYYSIKESEKEQKERFLEKLLKDEPQNVECMLKLASVYFRTGKVSQGFDLIRAAYELDSKFVKNAKISKILDLALRLSDLRQRANKSKDYNLWNELGDIYFDMGIFKEAKIAYEYSLELNPNQESKRILLAICYGNEDDLKDAKKSLEEVVKNNPDSFYGNYYLAKLLKNELFDKRWIYYLKKAKELLKSAKLADESQREYLREDIESELQN